MNAAALLNVIVVPLIVSAAIATVMRWLRTTPRSTWAVAVAGGYVAGQLVLTSRAGLKLALQSLLNPSEARDWLPMCALLAAGVTLLSSSASAAWRRGSLAVAGLLMVAVPLRLVASNVRLAEAWTVPQKFGCIILLAATFGFVWLLLELSRDDDGPLLRLILLVVVCFGSAVVITLSGTIVGGQLCGVLASALIGTAVGRWLAATSIGLAEPSSALSSGATRHSALDGLSGSAAVVAISLGGLIVLALFYAELTPVDAALLVLALIATSGPLPAGVTAGPHWFQASIRAALCLFPLAVAIVRSLPTSATF